MAALVLVGACASDGDGAAPEEADGGSDDVAGEEAGDPPQDGTLRTTTYSGTHWTVHDARTSGEPPDGSEPDDAVTFVYVTVEVESTLEATSLRFPAGMFLLRSDAGEVSRSDGLLRTELESSIRLEPGEVLDGDLVFELERELDPADLTLTIEERGKQPASLPLAGDVPAPLHPTQGEIAGGRQTITPNSGPGLASEVDIEPLGVEFGLDHGSTRSATDTYFVFVELRAHGLAARTNVGRGLALLEIDGVARSPEDREGGTLLDEGEAVDQLIVFEVPVDAQQLELVVGEAGEQQARYPISFEPPAGD